MRWTNSKLILVSSLTLYLILLMVHPLPIEDSELGLKIKEGGLELADIQLAPISGFSTWPSTLLDSQAFQIDRVIGLTGYHMTCILLVVLAFLMMMVLALKQSNHPLIIGLTTVFCIPIIALFSTSFSAYVILLLPIAFCFFSYLFWIENRPKFVIGLIAITLVILLIFLPGNSENGLFYYMYGRMFYSEYGFLFTEATTIKERSLSIIGWVLTFFLMICFYVNRRHWSTKTYKFWLIVTIIGVLYCLFILSVNVLALISIPVLSYHLSAWWEAHAPAKQLFGYRSPLLVLLVLIPLIWMSGRWNPFQQPLGIGASKLAQQPATFFKQQQIEGPIFNNLLSANYLAYYLAPKEKLFSVYDYTDYSTECFKNEGNWQLANNKHQFGSLFFRLKGESEAGLTFLGRRLSERDQWALVYFEEGEWAVLVSRNEKNQTIIDNFEVIK